MARTKSHRPLLLLLVGVVVMQQFLIDIYLPSMPQMRHVLHETPGGIQLTLTFYFLGLGVSQLIYGPLADLYGRRPVLLAGVFIVLVASIGASFVQTHHQLLGYRFLQGIGMGAGPVMYRAVLRDVFQGAKLARAFSLIAVSWYLTPLMAPLIGGYIQHYLGWRWAFIMMAGYSAMMFLVLLLYLPETQKQKGLLTSSWRLVLLDYKILLTQRTFVGAGLCAIMSIAVFSAYCVSTPFLYQEGLGISPIAYGWLFCGMAIIAVLGTITNGIWVKRIGILSMMHIGLLIVVICVASMLSFAFQGFFTLSSIFLPVAFMMFASGLIFPNAMTQALMPFPQIAATAGALQGGLQMIIFAIITGVMSSWHVKNPIPLACMIGVIGAIMVFSHAIIYKSPEIQREHVYE